MSGCYCYVSVDYLFRRLYKSSQKSNESKDLCWAARLASTWILAKLKERRNVKGQAYPETLQQSGTWKRRDPVSYFGYSVIYKLTCGIGHDE